jgi:hypothetical protein
MQDKELFQKILLILTIAIAAIISSYSTYLGFETQVESVYFAAGLAAISGLMLLSFSYGITHVVKSDNINNFFKLILIPFILIAIFFFSTLWSIVGIAKNELQSIHFKSANSQFINRYSAESLIPLMTNAENIMSSLSISVKNNKINAEKGKFTGIAKRGRVSRNFEFLEEKINLSANQFKKLKNGIQAKFFDINENMAKLTRIDYLSRKDEYLLLLRKTNDLLGSIKNTTFTSDINICIASVSKAAELFEDIKEQSKYSQTTEAFINSEINSLNSYKEELETAKEALVFTYQPVDIEFIETNVKDLSFIYFFKILHWWALCLAIDFSSIALMSLLLKENDTIEYD